MTTTATLSTSVDFRTSETFSTRPHATSSSIADNFMGTAANGTNEFAAYIVNGSSIPDSAFNCPVQFSGLDYVDIPGLNMSVGKNYHPNASFYDGYCGIKGAHPRMAHCCQNMQVQPPFIKYPEIPIYLAPDNCSQYCRFWPADIDYWLWCLTQEGDSVSNAFCRWDEGKSMSTSGSLPRDGPFDPDGPWIKEAKSKLTFLANSASTASFWKTCVGPLVVCVLLERLL
ncbi:hypothetical protein KC367_g8479 [Hortaea werneckii]|nr:hypothetical protein KC367_g8479 [Hortaea werneckii]